MSKINKNVPTIKITEEVHEKLVKYKKEQGCKTFNEVINLLLKDSELMNHLKKEMK